MPSKLLIADQLLNEILGSKNSWKAGDHSTENPPLESYRTHLSTHDYDWGFPSLKGKGAELVKEKLDAAGIRCTIVSDKVRTDLHFTERYDEYLLKKKIVAVVVVQLEDIPQIRGEALIDELGIR